MNDRERSKLRTLIQNARHAAESQVSALRIVELTAKLSAREMESLAAEMREAEAVALRQQTVLDQTLAEIREMIQREPPAARK